MDKVLYDYLCRYFATLARVGNVSYNNVDKLLVLIFYKHFIYEDYRGNLSKEDYSIIEQALDCLFGSTCLIPYPNYLEMGKLHLGDITELTHRIIDNESHTQEIDNRLKYNEAVIGDNVRRIANAETRLDIIESTKVLKNNQEVLEVPDIVF